MNTFYKDLSILCDAGVLEIPQETYKYVYVASGHGLTRHTEDLDGNKYGHIDTEWDNVNSFLIDYLVYMAKTKKK